MDLEQILKNKRGTIIDVRSPGEFQGGHLQGSVNIPLPEISRRLEEIKKLPEPLVLCCASGNRSGQAHQYLQQMGLTTHNGGSWTNLQFFSSSKN
ncbi:MAG: rhodanese-like domain-containing protein [Chitinophagaceae bacterium]